MDAAHVELELVLEAASLDSVESLYCVVWLEGVVLHGFLCLPGPASDGKPVAAYPSSFQFAQYRRRVRPPPHVEGHGAARGLHIQTHRGADGVSGAVAAPGQLPAFGCRPSAQANRWAFLVVLYASPFFSSTFASYRLSKNVEQ